MTGVRKWTGRVVEVEEDGEVMTVELTPFGDTETTFIADFSTELVDSDGAGPVRKGDLIYLTARTVHSERGGVHSTSHIRRRLIGRWGEDELRLVSDKAERDARSLLDLIE
ncbi:hypothetical protein [Jannaschia sp. R86511]|uniref:hypothetical protein n=1 Tax=Jannaschia sp. R86511 TaxID=3093853 RepID=UPI0036D308A5